MSIANGTSSFAHSLRGMIAYINQLTFNRLTLAKRPRYANSHATRTDECKLVT
ncbi:MAG: hypothetical protein F6K55_42365 [Moorea sp. SIO4A3]|nr:hypothetical protein [Moorena sp. SIO4A3]